MLLLGYKKKLAFCIIAFSLTSCMQSKVQQKEFAQMQHRITKLEQSNNTMVKALEGQNAKIKSYESMILEDQLSKTYILDKYDTEIIIDGKINIMPNTFSDYDIAVNAISFSQRDRAMDILYNLKQNLDSKIANSKTQIQAQAQTQTQTKDEPVTQVNSQEDKQLKDIDYFINLKYEANYLIGYLHYVAKDYKSAIKIFMENYNYEEQYPSYKQKKEKFISNSLALAFSFYKIGRFDKYCQTIKASGISDKTFVTNQKLFNGVQAILATNKGC
jgi:hypothetical protein